jgi:hypothetical protein
MRPRHAIAVFSTLLVACGSGSESVVIAPTVRDSAGITIMEYPVESWDAAPEWTVSDAPLAVIGDDPDEVDIDLSTSSLGTMLDDGRVIAATMQPAQIYRFAADGSADGTIGRAGDGPGEYRFVIAMTRLGGDSIAVYDIVKRIALLFRGDGEVIGNVQFPASGVLVPPVLSGRLDDGTWVLQVLNPMAERPEGAAEIYRIDGPVLAWREGMEGFDTLFTLPGQSVTWGEIEAAGQRMEMGRQVGYGANAFLGVHGATIWATGGDRFTIRAYDAVGRPTRELRMTRPARPVSEAERERFRTVLREQYQNVAAMLPPGMLESEMAKIDQTVFAEEHPAISMMRVDQVGRLWVSPDLPIIDSVQNWRIFSPEGALIGQLQLPPGMLLSANLDRVVVRREDPETGLVRLEVWGLNPATCEECGVLPE